MRAWISDHPGCARGDVAAACGLTPQQVGDLLGADAGRLLTDVRAREQDFTDDDITGALRSAAAELGTPLSAARFDAAHGEPSSARIVQRFGSWNSACEAAGLATRAARANYVRGWTQDTVLDAVAHYLGSADAAGSYAGYAAWASRTPGAPSGQTVRNYLGTWSQAKARTLTERDVTRGR